MAKRSMYSFNKVYGQVNRGSLAKRYRVHAVLRILSWRNVKSLLVLGNDDTQIIWHNKVLKSTIMPLR